MGYMKAVSSNVAIKYELNLVRSAMPPETMVAAVPQNTA